MLLLPSAAPLPEAQVMAVRDPFVASGVVVVALSDTVPNADFTAVVEVFVIQIGVDAGVDAVLPLQ